ncbi:MAG TPA: FHA domain-containing protein [Gemmataceae bacterium]|nr:FHA domain-containing protein [Gemmataceae bacterium]
MSAIEIRVLTGPHRNHCLLLTAPAIYTVGRREDCAICFTGDCNDLLISRQHCQLEFDPPRIVLRDLASRNGTYLNGRRILSGSEVALEDGDLVTVGNTSFRIGVVDGSELHAPVADSGRDCLQTC